MILCLRLVGLSGCVFIKMSAVCCSRVQNLCKTSRNFRNIFYKLFVHKFFLSPQLGWLKSHFPVTFSFFMMFVENPIHISFFFLNVFSKFHSKLL